MKALALDFGTWRAEITVPDDTKWWQIFHLISDNNPKRLFPCQIGLIKIRCFTIKIIDL